MWLFEPDNVPQPLHLDLELGEKPRRATPRPRATSTPTEESAPTPFQSDSAVQHAVALVTAFIAEGDDDLVTAVMVDQGEPDLLRLGLASAWLCAGLIHHVDQLLDGAGTQWLRELATELAARDSG